MKTHFIRRRDAFDGLLPSPLFLPLPFKLTLVGVLPWLEPRLAKHDARPEIKLVPEDARAPLV